jgi:hypothetical protein
MNEAGRQFERAVGRAHFPAGAVLCAVFMAYLVGHIVFAFLRGTLPIRQAPYGAEPEISVEPGVHGVSSASAGAHTAGPLGAFR